MEQKDSQRLLENIRMVRNGTKNEYLNTNQIEV